MAISEDKKKLLTNPTVEISPRTQEILNKPLKKDEPADPRDTRFLAMLVEKIEKGEIDLYQPSSLLNHAVYDKLDENARGKADYDGFTLLATIREIYSLWKAGHKDTYQIVNLVHQIRLTKERLEELGGDIYII